MKYLIATFGFSLALLGHGQGTGTLQLVIKNFDDDKGKVLVALYDSEHNWLGDEPFQKADTTIYSTEEVIIYFTDIPAGEYAISLYHDENENGDLDTNSFGIPQEDYAFSNNAKGMFGPANYASAAFQITENENIQTIDLN